MHHLHFGFSYIGLLFLLMLFIPNLIWVKFKPINYDKEAESENKVFLFLERTGEVLVTSLVLVFDDFNIKSIEYWSLFLLFAFIIMVLYELYWLRYFLSKRTMNDFYCRFLGIPIPGATLPVLAFILLSLYGKNIFLFLATILLGIGHIGIHIGHYKRMKKSSTA
ncbi:MAG: hypothetical protein K2N64_00090 [Anaeroplasmataceae bacterium]|nr:hypothetical protein [Anaeroplasmataceae bacterium]